MSSSFIKDIVVFLDSSSESAVRLKMAIDIARRHASHLIAAYVAAESILGRHPEEFARGVAMDAVVTRDAVTEDADLARIRQDFVEETRNAAVSSEWQPIARYGTAAEVVARTRYADLSIVGQFTVEESHALWRPEELLFAFGGPALIVPRKAPPHKTVGRKILVAWNVSREAKRAVGDSMPFLVQADQVTILVIDGPEQNEPGAALAARLARHGIDATTLNVAAQGRNIGQIIIDQARRIDADMIVMGAYGHMRIIEMVFGGATRTILGQMTVPVLMSH